MKRRRMLCLRAGNALRYPWRKYCRGCCRSPCGGRCAPEPTFSQLERGSERARSEPPRQIVAANHRGDRPSANRHGLILPGRQWGNSEMLQSLESSQARRQLERVSHARPSQSVPARNALAGSGAERAVFHFSWRFADFHETHQHSSIHVLTAAFRGKLPYLE